VEPDDASVLIVNTCGFIESARQESIGALQELAALKQPNQLLIAAGCMAQRYGDEVVAWVPGIDGVIGTRRWMDIVRFVRQLRRRKHPQPLYHLPDEAKTVGTGRAWGLANGRSRSQRLSQNFRRLPTALRLLRHPPNQRDPRQPPAGGHRGRSRAPARPPACKNCIIIAQDTTDYGHDLGLKNGLSQLLKDHPAAPDIPWIRIMYAYPGYVTDELIETMATTPQIVPYLDIPLQHGHRETLKRMRRPANIEWVYSTLEKLRRAMPDIAIRTTFIVGYPGETDEEFDALKQFVSDLQFDRVGAFTYSYEASTPSANVSWQVPEEVKEARLDELMSLQQPISLARNQAQVGRTCRYSLKATATTSASAAPTATRRKSTAGHHPRRTAAGRNDPHPHRRRDGVRPDRLSRPSRHAKCRLSSLPGKLLADDLLHVGADGVIQNVHIGIINQAVLEEKIEALIRDS
jgi:ribosomal protein S12 methylthiotransferase